MLNKAEITVGLKSQLLPKRWMFEKNFSYIHHINAPTVHRRQWNVKNYTSLQSIEPRTEDKNFFRKKTFTDVELSSVPQNNYS
jgi:hypothetical protein